MSVDLSDADRLRLNVLLAQNPLAIRIDESRCELHALMHDAEISVSLHPTGSDDRYYRAVRELISTHVTGAPGGYPVHIGRWTRMGQMRDASLEHLLLLAEPEAVIAVVSASGLTDELARRAWWAGEDPDKARHMLAKPKVRNGDMGPRLAAYLFEHLPFETESSTIIETLRLVLYPGLLTERQCTALWHRGKRKPLYYLGFLAARPHDLPTAAEMRGCSDLLRRDVSTGEPIVELLAWTLSASGQAYLWTLQQVLAKPADQEVVSVALDVAAARFAAARPEGPADLDLPALEQDAEDWLVANGTIQPLLPTHRERLRALRFLSGLGYGLVRPVFRDSTAIGSLMRRKIEPLLGGVMRQIDAIRVN